MDIKIRRAESIHSAGVLRLLQQIAEYHHLGRPDIFKAGASKYNEDELAVMFDDADRPVFVAVDDAGTVIGYCFCQIHRNAGHAVINDFSTLFIDDFCVDTSCRGRGIGHRLFNEVKEYAKGIGVYYIDLNVWEFNESAIKFYTKCGFSTQKRKMELIL